MTNEMHARSASATPARVLVVAPAEHLAGEAVAVIRAAGHEPILAPSWDAAVDLVNERQPEAVLISAADDIHVLVDFFRRIRAEGGAPRPVFVSVPVPVGGEERKEMLRAGAAHVFEAPLDQEELLLRLDAALRSSRDADRARAVALIDPETGLYNASGLSRRGRELAAEAMRGHAALACAVIGASLDGLALTREASVRSADALRARGRLSDVIGRVGPLEFVVLAPGTETAGAMQLTRRLSAGVLSALENMSTPAAGQVRAGYTALGNLAYAPMESSELLARATGALRSGRTGRQVPYFAWLPPSEFTRRVTT